MKLLRRPMSLVFRPRLHLPAWKAAQARLASGEASKALKDTGIEISAAFAEATACLAP